MKLEKTLENVKNITLKTSLAIKVISETFKDDYSPDFCHTLIYNTIVLPKPLEAYKVKHSAWRVVVTPYKGQYFWIYFVDCPETVYFQVMDSEEFNYQFNTKEEEALVHYLVDYYGVHPSDVIYDPEDTKGLQAREITPKELAFDEFDLNTESLDSDLKHFIECYFDFESFKQDIELEHTFYNYQGSTYLIEE